MDRLNIKRYPIGIQTFSEIRKRNYLYIDKTEYIYRLSHLAPKYIFLGRPRRFGKSLLTSTLQCYFEGRKELFKGLAIERLEKDWTEYPVLHFDMSTAKHSSKERLIQEIELKLLQYEAIYERGEGNIPNQEVRMGIMKSLLPNYIGTDYDFASSTIAKMGVALYRENDMDKALSLLQTFLKTVPYCNNTDYEGHYQQMLYIIFTLLGAYVDVGVNFSMNERNMESRVIE